MLGFTALTDSLIRRLLKVVIKRNLSQVLATEVDLEQLEPQLSKGSLDLTDILLDSSYLNEHTGLPPGLRITSALVGRIHIGILPLRFEIEDVVISLASQASAEFSAGCAEPANPRSSSGYEAPDESQDSCLESFYENTSLPASAVGEGETAIYKLLQSVLQRATVDCRRLVLRVQLQDNAAFTINIDALAVANPAQVDPFADMATQVVVHGLGLRLLQQENEGEMIVFSLGNGLHGLAVTIDITLASPLTDTPGHVVVHAELGCIDVAVALPEAYLISAAFLQSQRAASQEETSKAVSHRRDPTGGEMGGAFTAVHDPSAKRILLRAMGVPPNDDEVFVRANPEDVDKVVEQIPEEAVSELAQSFFSAVSSSWMREEELSTEEHGPVGVPTVQLSLQCPLASLTVASKASNVEAVAATSFLRGIFVDSAREDQIFKTSVAIEALDIFEVASTASNEKRTRAECDSMLACFARGDKINDAHQRHQFLNTISQLNNCRWLTTLRHSFGENNSYMPFLHCSGVSGNPAVALHYVCSTTTTDAVVCIQKVHAFMDIPSLTAWTQLLSMPATDGNLAMQADCVSESKLNIALYIPQSFLACKLSSTTNGDEEYVCVLASNVCNEAGVTKHLFRCKTCQRCMPTFDFDHLESTYAYASDGQLLVINLSTLQIFRWAVNGEASNREMSDLVVAHNFRMALQADTAFLIHDEPQVVFELMSPSLRGRDVSISGEIKLSITPHAVRVTDSLLQNASLINAIDVDSTKKTAWRWAVDECDVVVGAALGNSLNLSFNKANGVHVVGEYPSQHIVWARSLEVNTVDVQNSFRLSPHATVMQIDMQVHQTHSCSLLQFTYKFSNANFITFNRGWSQLTCRLSRSEVIFKAKARGLVYHGNPLRLSDCCSAIANDFRRDDASSRRMNWQGSFNVEQSIMSCPLNLPTEETSLAALKIGCISLELLHNSLQVTISQINLFLSEASNQHPVPLSFTSLCEFDDCLRRNGFRPLAEEENLEVTCESLNSESSLSITSRNLVIYLNKAVFMRLLAWFPAKVSNPLGVYDVVQDVQDAFELAEALSETLTSGANALETTRKHGTWLSDEEIVINHFHNLLDNGIWYTTEPHPLSNIRWNYIAVDSLDPFLPNPLLPIAVVVACAHITIQLSDCLRCDGFGMVQGEVLAVLDNLLVTQYSRAERSAAFFSLRSCTVRRRLFPMEDIPGPWRDFLTCPFLLQRDAMRCVLEPGEQDTLVKIKIAPIDLQLDQLLYAYFSALMPGGENYAWEVLPADLENEEDSSQLSPFTLHLTRFEGSLLHASCGLAVVPRLSRKKLNVSASIWLSERSNLTATSWGDLLRSLIDAWSKEIFNYQLDKIVIPGFDAKEVAKAACLVRCHAGAGSRELLQLSREILNRLQSQIK